MCPGCIGTTLLLLSGASSAGGLAAFKLRSITRLRTVRERFAARPPPAGGSSRQPKPAYDPAGKNDSWRRAGHDVAARSLQAPHAARPGPTSSL
jgi:hypothetical protein